MSYLDELKEQLGEAVAAQDFDTATRLRGEIDSLQQSARIRGVEPSAQAAYLHHRRIEEEPNGPS